MRPYPRLLWHRGQAPLPRRAGSLRPAHGTHLAAAAAAAEEPVAAVGFESRHACSRRHLDSFLDLTGLRIEPPQIAFFTFPGAVPQLAIDPGDPGNDAVALDGAK